MAISHTLILSQSFSANASPQTTTGTLTAIAGRLYLAAACWSGTTLRTFTSLVHNATNNPCTFVKVGDKTSNTVATPLARLVSCRGMNTVDSNAGTLTITLSGNPSRINLVVSEFSGVDTSGTSGSGALLQTTVSNAADAAGSLNITFAALSSSNNRLWGAGQVHANTTFTPDANYVEIADTNPGEVDSLETQWDNGSGDLTCTFDPVTAADMAAIGHEIVAAAAGNPVNVLAAGASISHGSAKLAVLRGVKASGAAFGQGSSQVAVFRGMKASGMGAAYGSSQASVLRGMRASGIGMAYGASQASVLRGMQASGLGIGYGSAGITVAPPPTPVAMLASGLGMSIGTAKLSVIRGLLASGAAFSVGTARTGVSRGMKASGSAAGAATSRLAVLRGMLGSGFAAGYGSASFSAGGGPKQIMASGLGMGLGSAKLDVIHLSCFPTVYTCTVASPVAVTEVSGPAASCSPVTDPDPLLLDDALCIQGPFVPPPPILYHLEFDVQPTDSAPNVTLFPFPSVLIKDAGGAVVTDFVGDATVSLIIVSTTGPNAPSWTLTGDLVAGFGEFDFGLALWDAIQVSGLAPPPFDDSMFCKLQVTCPGVTGVISNTFFVGGGPT